MKNLYRIDDIERNLRIARFSPLDVLVVGGTGAGKSSTINALFQRVRLPQSAVAVNLRQCTSMRQN